MPGPQPTRVSVTPEERGELERLVRAHGTARQVAPRAQIILAASGGWTYQGKPLTAYL